MFSKTSVNLSSSQKAYACADGNSGPCDEITASSERDLTHQTGQVLLTLGHMFVNVPAFSDHIDQGTGELLISLGKKLKTRY